MTGDLIVDIGLAVFLVLFLGGWGWLLWTTRKRWGHDKWRY